MQFLSDLWLPIVVSGIAVFIVSALVWTVLPNHKTEFGGVPVEDAIMNSLRSAQVVPGRYVVPWMGGGGELMKTPEGRAKVEAGPIVYLTVQKPGMPSMGTMIGQSLVSALVISVFVGYLAWHALPPAAAYLEVFRITGTATFMAYALGAISESIWFARPWKSLAMNTFDALLYAGVAGGVFGWLWPI
jgi:hypothetical protein